MPSRNQIKWAPFNSVMNTKKELNNLAKNKEKLEKPVLSEDQINYFNMLIMESLNNMIKLEFSIYFNGFIYKKESIVKKIDSLNGIIYLENKSKIFINNIINIERI